MDPDLIMSMLRSAATGLAIIPLADLEAYVDQCAANNYRSESLGPIIDPTAYRDALYDGCLDDARNQLEIARHLLAARRAIEKREQGVRR